MYVEMTTLSMPTFLLEGFKFAAYVLGAWLLVIAIGMLIYRMTEK